MDVVEMEVDDDQKLPVALSDNEKSPEVVQLLKDDDGKTLFDPAVTSGSPPEAIKFPIDADKADGKKKSHPQRDADGMIPLQYAAESGSSGQLVEAGNELDTTARSLDEVRKSNILMF